MVVNLASKYSPVVDERFKLKALTESAVNQSYDWSGVATVTVYDIPTVAMNDYTRTGTNRYGAVNELGNNKTDYTLTKDRSFTFTIDKGNAQETMNVMDAGKALARQQDEVIIPEIDIYRLNVMSAAAVANGATTTLAISSSNAYDSLLTAQEWFADHKVPATGLIAFVTPAFYTAIKEDNSFIRNSDIAQNLLINGQIGQVDGIKLVRVPTTYLPANTAFTVVNPIATVAPKKLEDYKIHDNPPGINGNLVEGRLIYDAFVLTSKKDALYSWKIA